MMYQRSSNLINLICLSLLASLITACGGDSASSPASSSARSFNPATDIIVQTPPFQYQGVWRHTYALVDLTFDVSLNEGETIANVEWQQVDAGPVMAIHSRADGSFYINTADTNNHGDPEFRVNVTTSTSNGGSRSGSGTLTLAINEVWNPDRENFLFTHPEYSAFVGDEVQLLALITGTADDITWEITNGISHAELDTKIANPTITLTEADADSTLSLKVTVTFSDGSQLSETTSITVTTLEQPL